MLLKSIYFVMNLVQIALEQKSFTICCFMLEFLHNMCLKSKLFVELYSK